MDINFHKIDGRYAIPIPQITTVAKAVVNKSMA